MPRMLTDERCEELAKQVIYRGGMVMPPRERRALIYKVVQHKQDWNDEEMEKLFSPKDLAHINYLVQVPQITFPKHGWSGMRCDCEDDVVRETIYHDRRTGAIRVPVMRDGKVIG